MFISVIGFLVKPRDDSVYYSTKIKLTNINTIINIAVCPLCQVDILLKVSCQKALKFKYSSSSISSLFVSLYLVIQK
ncbi:hypothetical protein [Rickettsia bellii]|uniref:hypothetical protein n=1 Tax=Rickettsia bellii TaxID=33990 RepID=UPI00397B51F3